MKKFIVLGIVMVMVLSATAAMSAVFDNDWLVTLKASTDVAAKVGAGNAIFGLKTAAGDTTTYYTPVANLASSPEVNYSDSTHPYPTTYATGATRYYVAKKGGAPLGVDPGQSKTIDWLFRIAGAGGSTVYLTAWNTTGTTSAINAGTNQIIKLYEANAEGVKGDLLWTFNPGAATSWTSTGGIVGAKNDQLALNGYFSKSYTLGAADNAGGAYQYFVLEAQAPEPGSIVALFSGLVGLAGFGIRRRK